MEDKITLHDIVEVLEMDTDDITSYYHKPSESMVVIMKEDIELAQSNDDTSNLEEWKKESVDMAKDFLNNKQDYLSFPSEEDYNEQNIILEFINHIAADKEVYEKLSKAMEEEHTIRRFKDELFKVNLIDEWYDFREEKFLEVAEKWVNKNNIAI
ncbi:MAG: UPF0158 family protein [Clostridium sp.]